MFIIKNILFETLYKEKDFHVEKQFDPNYQPTKQVQEEIGPIPFVKSKGKEEKKTKQTKERKQKKAEEN